MKVKLDAVVAGIVQLLDSELVALESEFKKMWRPVRIRLILIALRGWDIAQTEKSNGLQCWRPSLRLQSYSGGKGHGMRDQFERIESPPCFSTLTDEFVEVLNANRTIVEKLARRVIRGQSVSFLKIEPVVV